jgi:hypothetical protein
MELVMKRQNAIIAEKVECQNYIGKSFIEMMAQTSDSL